MSQPIPLQEVPRRFFNQKDWKLLRSRAPNEITALCFLNAPSPDPHDPNDLLMVYGRSRRKADRLYQIGRRLLRQYRRSLINGDYIASRLGPEGRIEIPASDWIDCWPLFATGRANSYGVILDDIQIQECGRFKLQRACEEWLAEHPERHDQKKTAIFQDAKVTFGGRLSHAIFNAAYKQVLCRKRGRPSVLKQNK